MRIAALALSTVLLSGCSWLGLGGQKSASYNQNSASGRYNAPAAGVNAMRGQNPYNTARRGPCEITSVSHPIPAGCSPEQVTIALPNSGSQYGGQYGQNSNYGQYDQQAQTPSANSYGKGASVDAMRAQGLLTNVDHQYWQRPRLRMNGSLGFETSVSGKAFSPNDLPTIYQPQNHGIYSRSGSEGDGAITEVLYSPYDVTSDYFTDPAYTPDLSGISGDAPDVSISDLYAAPFTAAIGAEYGVSEKFSVFGNASYSSAQGESAGGRSYEGDVFETVYTTNYTPAIDLVVENGTDSNGNPTTTTTEVPRLNPDGSPIYVLDGAPSLTGTRIIDTVFARTEFEANDMQRAALEVGGRYYFPDAFASYLERPLSPYIAVSAGGAHYNELQVKQSTTSLLIDELFTSGTTSFEKNESVGPQTILESGWVPTGALTVGAEWQITPQAALAFETGVKFEGGRDMTAGGSSESNIAIPLTLRGSIGF